jgi:hypothetical protein
MIDRSFILRPASGRWMSVEGHMPSDRPGLIMRRRLRELLRANGEEEIHGRANVDGLIDPLAVLPAPGAAEAGSEVVYFS